MTDVTHISVEGFGGQAGPTPQTVVTQPPKPKRRPFRRFLIRMKRFSTHLVILRSIITSAALFVVFCFVIAYLIRDIFFLQRYYFEPIGVPKELTEMGYTPQVVTQRLLDQVRAINVGATTAKDRQSITPDWSARDLKLPLVELSLRSVIGFFKDIFGRDDVVIGGDVVRVRAAADCSQLSLDATTCDQDKNGAKSYSQPPTQYHIQLRVSSRHHPMGLIQPKPMQKMQEIFHDAAIEFFRATDPYIVAAYFSNTDKSKVKDAIAYCHQHCKEEDIAFADNLLGLTFADQGLFEEAIESYQRGDGRPKTGTKPRAIIHSNWGIVYLKNDEPDEAAQKFKIATQLDQKYSNAWNNWGNALRAKKQPDEAAKLYRKAIEVDSKNSIAWRNLGLIHHDKKEYKDAIERFRRAFELNPKNASTLYAWALSLNLQNKKAEAINKLKEAIGVDAKYSNAYDTVGLFLIEVDEDSDAAFYLEMAVQLGTTFRPTYDRLIKLYIAQGYPEDAERITKKRDQLKQ